MQKELDMIDLNITAVHILTKLFLKDFVKKDKGYILNVASSAGFLAGPYLSTYYATKNYVLKLTMAINEELRKGEVMLVCQHFVLVLLIQILIMLLGDILILRV